MRAHSNCTVVNCLRKGRNSGSTLVKWMVFLGIAFAFLLIAGVRVCGCSDHSDGMAGAAKADIGTLSGFLISYQITHDGKLPATITALVEKGIITEEMSKDPWGNPYQLVVPAKRSKDKFDLFSLGKKINDESDNIGNWDE